MSNKSKPSELDRSSRIVSRICRIAGEPRLIDKLSRDLASPDFSKEVGASGPWI